MDFFDFDPNPAAAKRQHVHPRQVLIDSAVCFVIYRLILADSTRLRFSSQFSWVKNVLRNRLSLR